MEEELHSSGGCTAFCTLMLDLIFYYYSLGRRFVRWCFRAGFIPGAEVCLVYVFGERQAETTAALTDFGSNVWFASF